MQLLWLALGYCFIKQASLATFSPYFLFYGRESLVLLASIRCDIQAVVNMDDPKMWIDVCKMHICLFQPIMPMAFDNLAIA